MIRGFLVLAVLALGTMPATAQEATGERVALVIGNAAYEHAQRLVNPLNDAAAIAAKLDDLGFAVTRAENLGRSGFLDTLSDFARAARGAELAVVYYSGHGLQRAGQSYLMPVDARLDTELDLERQVRLASLVQAAQSAAIGVVIVDACRDNPFVADLPSGTKSAAGLAKGLGRDLEQLARGSGTLVAYAAQPGQVAQDGTGGNSPYAAALLQHIDRPIDVRLLFDAVREEVWTRTNEEQRPAYRSELPATPIRLAPGEDPDPTPDSSDDEPSPAARAWAYLEDQLARTEDTAARCRMLDTFLASHPDSDEAALARIRQSGLGCGALVEGGPEEAPEESPAHAGEPGTATTGDSIISALVDSQIEHHFHRTDRIIIEETLQVTLETAGSGTIHSWRNPETSASGRITVKNVFQDGRIPCRKFSQIINLGHAVIDTGDLTACREPSGNWYLIQ